MEFLREDLKEKDVLSEDGSELRLNSANTVVRIGAAQRVGKREVKIQLLKASNSSWFGVIFSDTNRNTWASASTGFAVNCKGFIHSQKKLVRSLKGSFGEGSVVTLRVDCERRRATVS